MAQFFFCKERNLTCGTVIIIPGEITIKINLYVNGEAVVLPPVPTEVS